MLTKIKSVLAGIPPALPAASSVPVSTPDAVKAQVDLKQKQLRRGSTKARVDTLTAELDTAQRELAHATQAHGGALYEEKDSTAEATAVQQAGNRVAALEAALAVAIQKDDEAQSALMDATRQASIAADDEANTAFKVSVLELEGLLFGELKRAVDKVGVTLNAVKDRSGGDGGVASSLKDFLLWFPVYRDRACSSLIPTGRTFSQVLDEKKKPFSAWADDVKYSMSRRTGR